MWPWIKHWRDWAMNDLWPLYRISPQPQALHYSYEKAGLTLHDQPIPWNAEAVLVEALLRLPDSTAARKSDFLLRVPGREPFPAEQSAPPATATTATASSSASRRPARPSPPNCCAASARPRPTHAAVSQPRGVPAKPAPADADAVRAPRRRERRLPDLRLQPVPRSAGQRRARSARRAWRRCSTWICKSSSAASAAAPSTACRPGCAARNWPAGRRWSPSCRGGTRAGSGRGRRPGCSATVRWRASACAAFRSSTSSVRCASPTRASSCRTAAARCG